MIKSIKIGHRFVIMALAVTLVVGYACRENANDRIDLSKVTWDKNELKRYLEPSTAPPRTGGVQVAVVGKYGMVTSTSGVLATHVGIETLKMGGSAADAIIATSLAQIALTAGAAISYAGVMTMVYYDAATGEIHSMNAAYNTVQGEDDPMSIPGIKPSDVGSDQNFMQALNMIEPSGRTVLVPGFMAGAQATHDRFGKLPWVALFEPAIYVAEEGIPVSGSLSRRIQMNKKILSRLPETKAVFTKENGEFYESGDNLQQSALAKTLRKVASEGATYMYTGGWARKFVDAVRADGGKMTMKDMQDYKVIWSKPVRSTYKDFEVYAYGMPASGGVHTVEALNLLELADLRQFGMRHWESPEALKWFSHILRVSSLSSFTAEEREKEYPGIDLSLASRATKGTAKWIWDKIRSTNGAFPPAPSLNDEPKHSAAVVAVDRWGNVAAVLHSINTIMWGKEGIFVDGISIPDSAWFQQKEIAKAGPGNRLPESTNPCIIMKDGKPFLGSSAIGSSLHQQTIQGLYYMMEYGMNPNEAVSSPAFMGGEWGRVGISMVDFEFGREVIEGIKALGVRVQPAQRRPRFWIAVMIDPETRELRSTDWARKNDSGELVPMGLVKAY